ncbi:hypothetical protein ES319_A05G400800v1 [Gossypium barbadense]|uniref:Uncharacterized protein n=2 Tax=Gossypium TaxID=3633 RepID=A0A5J5W0B2_GOSBA|nr:hypothetical protein ES319_A05G400800v1 [Gossypium barbadense]TYH20408.1 hypothetical protein ES288_A05G427600v1 [Gossypium darwinii]
MASSISFTSTPSFASPCFHHKNPLPSFPIWVPCRNPTNSSASALFPICFAAKPQTGGPVKKRSSSAAGNKKRRKGKSGNDDGNLKEMSLRDVEIVEENDDFDEGSSSSSSTSTTTRSLAYYSHPLPKPPAGFVVDEPGRVLMASNKRIATIVDSVNNNPLECVIRRVFKSSRGDECMLLCPVDMPVQILKSTNIDGWSAVSDEEVEAILPTAEYALAKVHMHLVHSGFCYTARGGFCYSEDDIFDFRSDDCQDIDGLPTEGIEITCFHLDGAHYMIYTPSDPLLFVAFKDQNGILQIADDELLEDPAIMSAIDEETEFNALVEEEAALLESLLGER